MRLDQSPRHITRELNASHDGRIGIHPLSPGTFATAARTGTLGAPEVATAIVRNRSRDSFRRQIVLRCFSGTSVSARSGYVR